MSDQIPTSNAVVLSPDHQLSPVIAELGSTAVDAFIEFFTARIRNTNTRQAYYRNTARFFDWLEEIGISLGEVKAVHAAAYIEQLQENYSTSSTKQHLAGLRMLGSFLVTRQILPFNPFLDVRGPRHVVTTGSTPALSAEDARTLFDSIDTTKPAGLRDRAFIAVMIYTFARVSAVSNLEQRDYYQVGRRMMIDFAEKGGKKHTMPAHHNAEKYLDEYLATLDQSDTTAPLFQALNASRDGFTGRPFTRQKAWKMVKRRCTAAGIGSRFTNHSFRATGITTYLKAGGQLENAQYMAGHASATTTKLYDRRQQEITLDEVERIVI